MEGSAAQESALPAGQTKLVGLLAEFETPAGLLDACRAVHGAGFQRWDAHAPFAVHGLERAMGLRRTVLPWFVFAAGVAGLGIAYLLEWYCNTSDYPLNIGGKPLLALPAYIPVMFELTVLFSAVTAFGGVLLLNRLPELHHPLLANERFRRASRDRFFISIEAADPLFEEARTAQWLRERGAVAVETLTADAAPPRLPRGLIFAGVFVAALSLVPLVLIAKARATLSERNRPYLFDEMVAQPKYKPQTASPFFEDGQAARPQAPGTIARGELQADDHYWRGLADNKPAGNLPWPATAARMQRGRERFDIYCATCHGLTGAGDGMITQRATSLKEGTWVPPMSLHDPRILNFKDGELFTTLTYGTPAPRKMPAYGPQIPVDDRWAIVLYIRALQRSQNAKLEDVPEEIRPSLK